MVKKNASHPKTSEGLPDLSTLAQVIEYFPLIVTPNTLVSEAIHLMSNVCGSQCQLPVENTNFNLHQSKNSYCLVVENQNLLGIITEKDIVKMTAERISLSQVTVAAVMTREIISLTLSNSNSHSQNALTALALMHQHRIRHLPILDEQSQVLGIVTHNSISQILQPTNLLMMRVVADVMIKHAIYAYPGASILSLAQLMAQNNISCVVIVENHEESYTHSGKLIPVGIITERDIIQFQALGLNLELPAVTVMSSPLFCINSTDSLWSALTEMQAKKIRRLVVPGKQGELLGLITQADLVQLLDPLEMGYIIAALQQKIEAQTTELRQVNEQLLIKISESEKIEQILRVKSEELEQRVLQRTAELAQANTQLQQEINYSKQQESKLNDVLNDASAAIVRLRLFANQDWEQEYLSAGCEEVFGYTSQELMEDKYLWWSRLHLEDRENLIIPGFASLLSELFVQTDYRFYHKDGSLRWISSACTSRHNEDANCWNTTIVNRDITQRKTTEAALRDSEERYRSVIKAMREGIVVQDVQGKIITCNASAERILGLTKEQIMGRTSIDPRWHTIHEDGSEFPGETHPGMETLRTGTPCFNVVMGVYKPDNSLSWILINSQPLFQPGESTPYAVVVSFSDITRRKEAEEKIHEQAALLDIATDAICVRDLDNRILFWNQGAENLYGYSAAEMLSKNANEILYKDTYTLQVAIKITIETGVWKGELTQIRKDGKKVLVASSWTLMRDGLGQPKSILTVNTDITEKKQLEQQFYRAQRLESLGTLASGIAHDLNNMLTPILAVSQLLPLKIKNLDERSQELLKMQETNAKRASALVKQILSFARGADSKKIVIEIKHLLLEINRVAKGTFPKSIEIETQIPDSILTVIADANQLHQILMNLIVNARDAMPDGGKLTILAEKFYVDENYAKMNIEANIGHYVKITIADTGIGISPENIEKIFEPFFTTKDIGKGTGLGLSTTIGIIKNHGGFITVSSELGKGSRFKVYLPASSNTVTSTEYHQKLPAGKEELVLVADDENAIGDITKSTLENYNYRVIKARDGIDAITIFAQHKNEINVVLIDMMMPIMDGEKAIRTLQKINPAVKIIAMSGLASTQMVEKAANIGVKQFLSKPFTAQELLICLHDILN